MDWQCDQRGSKKYVNKKYDIISYYIEFISVFNINKNKNKYIKKKKVQGKIREICAN